MRITLSVYFFWLILLAILQMKVFPYFEIAYVIPDSFICFVVFISFRIQKHQEVWFAGIAGIIKDIFSSQTFGTFFLIFTLFSQIIIFIRENIVSDIIFQLMMVFLIALLANYLQSFLFWAEYRNTLPHQQCLLSALYTFCMSFVLFPIFFRMRLVYAERN